MTTPDPKSREGLTPVAQALLSVREMRAQLDEAERLRREPIAVIGLGCRFPGGADDPDTFWTLLREGFDGISEVPPDRWDVEAFYDPDPDAPGKISTRQGGYLTSVDGFDADFFGISPRELISMDPQQRLLLEVSWEALEHAAQDPSGLAGSRTGVFFGLGSSDYLHLHAKHVAMDRIDAYLATGNGHALASGRLSYFLGLQGPSITVDTACSGSLVAVHLACQSLHDEECRIALAGGVNLILVPDVGVTLSRAHMLSADGRCRTFDAAASGFSRAEGCGVVVLKRLSHAIEDRDNVLAVLLGSAVNQDGRSSGLTAPNGKAQEAVLREALARARVEPGDVDFVEAHGTGTSLGDPIEARALGAVMGKGRPPERPLAIGSVKTNIGHLESAAGVAGLIKAVLAVHHAEIPPHLHLNQPNPLISWESLPLVVPTEPTPWPAKDGPRLAGVSSFGFGGTNAHVVLGEAPERPRADAGTARARQIFTASARTETALRAVAARHAAHLEQAPHEALADVCFTANAGRAHLDLRLAVTASSSEELATELGAYASGEAVPGARIGRVELGDPPEVAFLFTGQGSQYVGMGRDLYEREPVFRATVDRCAELLEDELDLVAALYPDAAGSGSDLDETAVTQPALFAVEVALAELWRSWGVEPTAVMGHSVGEYAAACVAGVFSLEDGLRLTAARGRLMQRMAGGSMAAVFADEGAVTAAIAGHADTVSVAAVNGPQEVVISGEDAAVDRILELLGTDGVESKRLKVSHAFHSPIMEPMLADFLEVLEGVEMREPRLALVSNVTGAVAGEEVAEATYWRDHARSPVRFTQGVDALYEMGYRTFVEVGPHPTLLGLASKCPGGEDATWVPSLRRGQEEWGQILDGVARLHTAGVDIDWSAFDPDGRRRRLPLPTYPFERKRYWLDAAEAGAARSDPEARWAHVADSAERAAGMVPIDLGLDRYEADMGQLDRLSGAYMERALHELGAFRVAGERRTAEGVLRDFGVEPTYRHLVGRWLDNLAAAGLLEQQGDEFVSLRPLAADAPDRVRPDADAAMAGTPFLFEYVERCGSMLVDVLTGRESPLETLFPGGSTETAEAIYRRWSVARYFNNIARTAAEALAHATPADAPLRLVEIGAGTGSTTASVLPALPPERTTYWFTDASEFFLPKAAAMFEPYPFVRYGTLDIEKDPADQGYGSGQFDAVVAANVLHATRDLDETLANVASLLAPGGVLVLLETTQHPSWFDVTTGLIEGWQQFEDAVRQDNPLVSSEQWQQVLLRAGFSEVGAYPPPGSPAEVLPNHVILACTPAGRPVETAAIRRGEVAQGDAAGAPDASAGGKAHELVEELRRVPPDDRHQILADWVRGHLMRTLHRDGERLVGHHDRLFDLGMDSLMAVEFRNVLSDGLPLEQPLPATLVFDHPTVDAIARYLAEQIFREEGAPSASAAWGGDEDDRGDALDAERLEQMTDAEVEALLNQRLEE